MGVKSRNFLLAFLVYSPTLVNAPLTYIYLLISFIGLFFMLKYIRVQNILKDDVVLFAFLFFSIIVYFFTTTESKISKSNNDFIPYSFFIATTIFFCRHIDVNILRIIFYFIIVEILIGVFEYVFGIQYIIKPISTGEMEFGSTDILYYNKVYGLSSVSSVYAQKIFTGFLLLYFLKLKKYRNLFLGLLFIGLLMTFNRTAIVATLFFFLLYTISEFRAKPSRIILISFLGIIVFGIVVYYFDVLMFQFFRGKNEVDFSGRDEVFPVYMSFIKENLLFGNFVNKLWIEGHGKIYHAHNSYLQTLASMGLFLSIILFIYLYKIITKKSLLFIIPILLYSVFQYGVLWGVSYLDIIFFSLIFYFYNQTT